MATGPNNRNHTVQIACACGCGKKFYIRQEELDQLDNEGIKLLSPRCRNLPFGWEIVEVRNDVSLIRQTIPGYNLPRPLSTTSFPPVAFTRNTWP